MSDSNTIRTACVIGAAGAIGRAFVDALCQRDDIQRLYAFSRTPSDSVHPKVVNGQLDYREPESIERAAATIDEPLDLIVVATGVLHDADGLRPEKTFRAMDADHMARVLKVNTIGPALVATHFLPKLRPASRSVFAALSARVGSIADNRLGGWYSYRASKAALNMILRTLAIEVARRNRHAIIVGLHPGTVDSALSEPFQANVPQGKLFTPQRSAKALLDVVDGLDSSASGSVFDWAGDRVPE
ncbi:MAG: SDR family NAD(P)-dependent oxidoreductase [Gammaproteobacteria bacterium]